MEDHPLCCPWGGFGLHFDSNTDPKMEWRLKRATWPCHLVTTFVFGPTPLSELLMTSAHNLSFEFNNTRDHMPIQVNNKAQEPRKRHGPSPGENMTCSIAIGCCHYCKLSNIFCWNHAIIGKLPSCHHLNDAGRMKIKANCFPICFPVWALGAGHF